MVLGVIVGSLSLAWRILCLAVGAGVVWQVQQLPGCIMAQPRSANGRKPKLDKAKSLPSVGHLLSVSSTLL